MIRLNRVNWLTQSESTYLGASRWLACTPSVVLPACLYIRLVRTGMSLLFSSLVARPCNVNTGLQLLAHTDCTRMRPSVDIFTLDQRLDRHSHNRPKECRERQRVSKSRLASHWRHRLQCCFTWLHLGIICAPIVRFLFGSVCFGFSFLSWQYI